MGTQTFRIRPAKGGRVKYGRGSGNDGDICDRNHARPRRQLISFGVLKRGQGLERGNEKVPLPPKTHGNAGLEAKPGSNWHEEETQVAMGVDGHKDKYSIKNVKATQPAAFTSRANVEYIYLWFHGSEDVDYEVKYIVGATYVDIEEHWLNEDMYDSNNVKLGLYIRIKPRECWRKHGRNET